MPGHNQIRYSGHPAWERLDPVEWPPEFLNGPRSRAKQLDMLQIDLAHAVRWVDEMQSLVDEELPDESFTAKRMLMLKEWEKSRHRDQKALHYRYDPLKRSRRLIERDIDKALAAARKKIAEYRVKLEARQVGVRAALNAADRPAPAEPAPRPRPVRKPQASKPTLHPALAGLDPFIRTMYENLAPDIDLAITPDDDLRRIWAERNENMSAELIEVVIEEINAP